MAKVKLLFFFTLLTATTWGQRFHIGVFGGLAAYNGELSEKPFPKKVTNGALGITLNYELTDHILLRGSYTYAVVGGADRYAKSIYNVNRNLAFESKISEFSLIGEYYLNDLNERRFSPFGFLGIAAFHFNPYAYNGTREKIFLKPLSTEGQGISGYPDRKPYSLIQPAIPIGAGIKFAVTEHLRIGLEAGLRITFTDYLDDVSKSYIDPNTLLAERGQLAVDMSYRGDELPDGDPNYPVKGFQRGGDDIKDFYYFAGFHITYRLVNGYGEGLFSNGARKSKTSCPVNIY